MTNFAGPHFRPQRGSSGSAERRGGLRPHVTEDGRRQLQVITQDLPPTNQLIDTNFWQKSADKHNRKKLNFRDDFFNHSLIPVLQQRRPRLWRDTQRPRDSGGHRENLRLPVRRRDVDKVTVRPIWSWTWVWLTLI